MGTLSMGHTLIGRATTGETSPVMNLILTSMESLKETIMSMPEWNALERLMANGPITGARQISMTFSTITSQAATVLKFLSTYIHRFEIMMMAAEMAHRNSLNHIWTNLIGFTGLQSWKDQMVLNYM